MPAANPTSNETSMYQDMFDKQVALTLSKHQDLGIARLFERQLGSQAPPGRPPPGRAGPACPRRRRIRAVCIQAGTGDAARGCRRTLRRAEHERGDGTACRAIRRAGAADHSARRADAGHQSIGASRAGCLGDGVGAAHAAHRRRQPEPQSLRRQSGRGMERRPRGRRDRGVQRRPRDAAAHDLSCLRLDRERASATSPICSRIRPRYREAIAAGSNVQAYIDEHREVRLCHRSCLRE